MAFEVLAEIAKLILQFAAILFIPLYLLLSLRERIGAKTLFQKVLLTFSICILLAMAVYPFVASLLEYTISVEYGIDITLLLFDSEMLTYFIVLLFVFLLYLIAFNKTKE